MLNLEELERKLDIALKKETSDSLTKWILEKRLKSYLVGIAYEQHNFLTPINKNLIVENFQYKFYEKPTKIELDVDYVLAA
jgi:hypothetical protein